MSANMIIPTAETDAGFKLLKDIIEIVKNPEAVEDAYKRRSDAVALSEDELAKATKARFLIAQADELKESLQKREDAIVSDKTAHEKAKQDHAAKVQSDTAKLAEWENRLNDKADKQAETDTYHVQAKAAIDKRAKEIEDEHKKWMDDYNQRVATITATEKTQKAENDRLLNEGKKLKAKAARLAAEAQSDG